MARQRHSPQKFRKSPARSPRVTRGRNATDNRQSRSPAKHIKGPVLKNESAARQQLQKQLAKKPIATPLTDSDDSDGLVTRMRHAGRIQQPIYASGGVAQGDKPGAHPSRKRKSMDDSLTEESPEKRRQTSQMSGLKRPAKSSLRSPLAPILTNGALSSSPANPASSRATMGLLASSAAKATLNTSILPVAETSVLGTLKPRKRQPSILQIIETNDSSGITADDENEFLPDDESTPLPASKFIGAETTPGSLRRPNKENTSSSALRRPTPRSTNTTSPVIPDAVYALSLSSPPTSPKLPLKITSKARTPRAVEEDSVMAPPRSSSSDASPPEQRTRKKNSISSKTDKAAVSMLTASLVSLKPSQSQPQRPRRQQRQKPTRNEFDIPEDSTGSGSHSPARSDREAINLDGSPFKRKPARRKAPVSRKGDKAGATASRQRGTSILSNISTNSKVSKRSAKNVQGANGSSNSYAKNSSSKAGGGARHLNTISRGRGREIEKENDTFGGGFDVDDDGDDELRRVRAKFEEIDGWGLEFEDVEVQDGSSQLGYR